MDEPSQDPQVSSCLCSMEGTQGSLHVPKVGTACSLVCNQEPGAMRRLPWPGMEWARHQTLGGGFQVAWSQIKSPQS